MVRFFGGWWLGFFERGSQDLCNGTNVASFNPRLFFCLHNCSLWRWVPCVESLKRTRPSFVHGHRADKWTNKKKKHARGLTRHALAERLVQSGNGRVGVRRRLPSRRVGSSCSSSSRVPLVVMMVVMVVLDMLLSRSPVPGFLVLVGLVFEVQQARVERHLIRGTQKRNRCRCSCRLPSSCSCTAFLHKFFDKEHPPSFTNPPPNASQILISNDVSPWFAFV